MGTAKLPGLGKSPARSREGAWAGAGAARGATGAAPRCALAFTVEQAPPGGTATILALLAFCSFPSAFSKVQTRYALFSMEKITVFNGKPGTNRAAACPTALLVYAKSIYI